MNSYNPDLTTSYPKEVKITGRNWVPDDLRHEEIIDKYIVESARLTRFQAKIRASELYRELCYKFWFGENANDQVIRDFIQVYRNNMALVRFYIMMYSHNNKHDCDYEHTLEILKELYTLKYCMM